jgi:hypothetical protein
MLLILQIALGIVLAIIILNFLPEILKKILVLAAIAVPFLILFFVQIFVPESDKQKFFVTIKELLIALVAIGSIFGFLLYTIKKIGPKFLLFYKTLWQRFPLTVRNLFQSSIYLVLAFLLIAFQLFLLSDWHYWPLLCFFILPYLIIYILAFYCELRSLLSIIKARWRLILLISAFWIIPSVSSYFIGIWFYPSFITNTLSNFYTWVEAAPIIDHGIDFTPIYPTVNYVKLIGLVVIPIFTGSPHFFRFYKQDLYGPS